MDNNNQAAFMGALNSLKEYAKVNGNIVTKQDVESYFKDLGLDDSKYQMITGYLLANDITVKGENGVDPSDAYMFMQINDGNAIALPFAKGFGWGAELNLTYIFEKLFEGEPGGGYPKERVVPEQRNKKILDEVRKVAFKDSLIDIFKPFCPVIYKVYFSKDFCRSFVGHILLINHHA